MKTVRGITMERRMMLVGAGALLAQAGRAQAPPQAPAGVNTTQAAGTPPALP